MVLSHKTGAFLLRMNNEAIFFILPDIRILEPKGETLKAPSSRCETTAVSGHHITTENHGNIACSTY